MNRKRILCLLPVLLFLCLGVSLRAFAEPTETNENSETFSSGRNIYVGDIITFKITATGFSSPELKEKFRGFEVVEIKEESDGYLISLRTFETGEQKILLGDKEILINVQSTLDDIEREGIFEGEASVIRPGFLFHWRILFYTCAGIFVLSGCIILVKVFLKKKTKPQSPYRFFLLRSGSLSAEDDNYFVDLTFYFKEYIESIYQCRIIGKTSVEIVNELSRIQALDVMLPEISKWLTECDRLKFTGIKASKETKQKHYGELLNLVEKIDKHKEGEA